MEGFFEAVTLLIFFFLNGKKGGKDVEYVSVDPRNAGGRGVTHGIRRESESEDHINPAWRIQ